MWTWRLAVATFVAVMLVATGYAELVLDVRAPRVVLDEGAVVLTEATLASRSDAFDAAMTAKYGPNAQILLQPQSPLWVVKLDDKIVDRAPATLRFSGAIGFVVIGPPGKIASMFPFRLELADKQPSHSFSMDELRMWLANSDDRINRYLIANGAGEAEGPCTELEPSDFGWAGKLLGLRAGDSASSVRPLAGAPRR